VERNIDRFRADLKKLAKLGKDIQMDLFFRHESVKPTTEEEKKEAKKLLHTFETQYQNWYSESSALIRQLLPQRLSEFESLYIPDAKRREVNALTYRIQDKLNGIASAMSRIAPGKVFDDHAVVCMLVDTQCKILKSAEKRFDSSLFDIRQLVHADLFDSELDTARELNRQGFGRGAGAVAGVVLEKHLSQVAQNHNLKSSKKHPTINDYNDALKTANVIDLPTFRFIQRLGDIRNLCDHHGQKEPSKDEVGELIDGVEKISKTVF
jgi:hypothetical protein